MQDKNKSPKRRRLVLVEDPLSTSDIRFLEDVIRHCNGKPYLNAVQYGSIGGNMGEPTDNTEEPVNTWLPGGVIIRKRYVVDELRKRYQELQQADSRNSPQSL